MNNIEKNFQPENINKTKNIIAELHHFSENSFENLLKKTFQNENWLKVYLSDSHHGFTHGNQVRLSSLKLIENLDSNEKEEFLKEGIKINEEEPEKYAVVAVELAALFHDCGRFNTNGEVISEEQIEHQILSAKRAKIFCEENDLLAILPDIEEAILCHDFQSGTLTPDLNPPKTIIGKIVQSADQMGWFHPGP